MSEQDYIPGTHVIRNLVDRTDERPYGTSDQAYLDQAENLFVSDRLQQLRQDPIEPAFTFAHMREIHRHLFQDVYAWAGEPRRVPMTKHSAAHGGTDYAAPTEMNALLRQQYTQLTEQDHLRGISDREEFARRLAGFWGEINHGHAFREGNTRSQTVFFTQLAERAGWNLDVARLSPHHPLSVYRQFVDARFEHQRLRGQEGVSAHEASQQLASVLGKLVEPDDSPEGNLRRGVAAAPEVSGGPTRTATRQKLHARHPELRDMKLDRHGLGDDGPSPISTATDYQL